MDLRAGFISVIDKVMAFTEEQHAILIMMQMIDERNGGDYAAMNQWAAEREQKNGNKRFKIGRTIKLSGLDDHDWNDHEAVIVGERALKHGIIKWPIRLKDHEDDPLVTSGYMRRIQKENNVEIPPEVFLIIAAYTDSAEWIKQSNLEKHDTE